MSHGYLDDYTFKVYSFRSILKLRKMLGCLSDTCLDSGCIQSMCLHEKCSTYGILPYEASPSFLYLEDSCMVTWMQFLEEESFLVVLHLSRGAWPPCRGVSFLASYIHERVSFMNIFGVWQCGACSSNTARKSQIFVLLFVSLPKTFSRIPCS